MARKRKPSHPGEILVEHYLKPLGIQKSYLADSIGISRNTLYKLIRGESRITAGIALRLAKALRTTPELWLNLQQKYDVWEAESAPIARSETIIPIIPMAAIPRAGRVDEFVRSETKPNRSESSPNDDALPLAGRARRRDDLAKSQQVQIHQT